MSDDQSITARILRIGVPISAITLVLSFMLIFSSTVLNWDEGYYLSSALGFLREGTLYVRMWDLPGDTSLINGGGQGYAFLIYLFLHKIFGVSVVVGRSLSLVCGLLSIYFCYHYVKRIFDQESAYLAAIFYAITLPFLLSISARFDTPSLLVSFLILIAWERAKNIEKPKAHFLFGLLSIIGLEFHLQISAFIFATWIGYLYLCFAPGKRDSSHALIKLLSFTGGLLISLSIFFVIHYLPEHAVIKSITDNCWMCDVKFFAKEVVRIRDLFSDYSVEAVIFFFVFFYFCAQAILAEGVSQAYSGTLKVRALMFLGAYIFFVIFLPPHREFFLWPIFAPLAGFSLKSIFYNSKREVFKFVVAMTLIIAWLRTTAVAIDRIIPNDETQSNLKIAACLKEKFPQDSKILAPGPMFIYLPEFINFKELGRGMKYVIPLKKDLNALSEEEAVFKMISTINPSAIWIGSTDWPDAAAVAFSYIRAHSKKYKQCCSEKVYCQIQ